MWTEIFTLLSVGLYCIGLCISIRFLLLFLSVCCFHRGWHIYLYRPLVLLFSTIAGLIDFSTGRSAQSGCSCASWRELNSCHCDWSQFREKALNFQLCCWISLWRLAGFIFWKWGVRWFLFTLFLMGDGHTVILLILLIGSLIDSLHHWYHFMFWGVFFVLFFCLAILSLTRVCTICFPCTFYLLIWHVVLMQNDKTGACECVCWIYFLKCKWFCVCVYLCECKREQFTVVIGYSPALWVHMFELALHSDSYWFESEVSGYSLCEPENTLVWLEFSFILQCGFLFQYMPVPLDTLCLLAHSCQHINVYTKAKTFADSGNSWQTFVV